MSQEGQGRHQVTGGEVKDSRKRNQSKEKGNQGSFAKVAVWNEILDIKKKKNWFIKNFSQQVPWRVEALAQENAPAIND